VVLLLILMAMALALALLVKSLLLKSKCGAYHAAKCTPYQCWSWRSAQTSP
jgi:hypothetical protein